MKFKSISLMVALSSTVLLFGCRSETSMMDIVENNSSSSSFNQDDSLIEKSMKELLKAIDSNNFDAFVNLLDESNKELYLNSDESQQTIYQQKFLDIDEKLTNFYDENWIKSVELVDIDYFNAIDYKGGNIDTYIESDFIYELDFRKENGRYVLRNGLSQLDDLLDID